jgi:lipoate-protein ligase A
VYYSASLLVKPDVSLVERYLRHPPREPEYRRGRSHREFMGALGAAAGIEDGGSFERRLRTNLPAEAL